MGRRTRMRLVKNTPNNMYFTDASTSDQKSIILSVAEFEAMRLKHYIKLNQSESASKMGVSQPTFSRILETAHQKLTLALIDGKNIKVFGGNFEYVKSFNGYGCLNCDYEWEDETAAVEKKVNCPKCNSRKVYHLVREPL
ncbi:MAG: DUF134 domain-containing protein [Promethearchaeota archaeon]